MLAARNLTLLLFVYPKTSLLVEALPILAIVEVSMKWKTKVDEAPQGLKPSDFEDWLWRREKPKALGHLANLRSRATFPASIDLPDENDVDPDMVTYPPRRHWCFLGEIATLHHLEMDIIDVDGGKIPLHFYTDSLGSELTPAQVQKGNTVAVLYATRHVFKFGEPGIRHEDPRMIKVRLLQ